MVNKIIHHSPMIAGKLLRALLFFCLLFISLPGCRENRDYFSDATQQGKSNTPLPDDSKLVSATPEGYAVQAITPKAVQDISSASNDPTVVIDQGYPPATNGANTTRQYTWQITQLKSAVNADGAKIADHVLAAVWSDDGHDIYYPMTRNKGAKIEEWKAYNLQTGLTQKLNGDPINRIPYDLGNSYQSYVASSPSGRFVFETSSDEHINSVFLVDTTTFGKIKIIEDPYANIGAVDWTKDET